MKLNKYIANEIRDNKKLYSQKELAKKYEVSIPTISLILNNKLYSVVEEETAEDILYKLIKNDRVGFDLLL